MFYDYPKRIDCFGSLERYMSKLNKIPTILYYPFSMPVIRWIITYPLTICLDANYALSLLPPSVPKNFFSSSLTSFPSKMVLFSYKSHQLNHEVGKMMMMKQSWIFDSHRISKCPIGIFKRKQKIREYYTIIFTQIDISSLNELFREDNGNMKDANISWEVQDHNRTL